MSVLERWTPWSQRHSCRQLFEKTPSVIALPRQVQLCCGGLDGFPTWTTVSHVSRTQHSAGLQLSAEEGSHVDYDVKHLDLSCKQVAMGFFGC